MTQRVSSTNIIFDRIVSALTNCFLKTADGDPAQARLAAIQMLQSYDVTTGADLLLVAQVIAFGVAALDNLSQSFANPELPQAQVLRLRGSANALNRAAQQCQRVLDRRGAPADAARMTEPAPPEPTDEEIDAVMRTITAMVAQPEPPLVASEPTPQAYPGGTAPMTRLQRRAAKLDARARRHQDVTRRHAERAALAINGEAR